MQQQTSIIDQFLSILPEDMPDLKESTDHLAPLKLRHQFAYYHGGREDKLGFEVRPGSFYQSLILDSVCLHES